MHRWTIVLAAGLLLASSCGASRPTAGPSSGETTVSSSPGPTADDKATATSPGGGDASGSASTANAGGSAAAGRWDTPCRESYGAESAAVLAYDGVPDRFGPLGPAPLLDVTLPTVTPTGPDDDGQVRTEAAPVNGGAVVAVTADRGDPADASVVAVVERGGTRRWVRCLPGTVLDVWVAAPHLEPATALIAAFPPGGAPEAQWSVLALDTGATVPGFAEGAAAVGLDPTALADAGVAAVSPSAVLIGHSSDDGSGWAVDTVVRYDLVTGTFTPIPPPPGGYGQAELALGPDDDVVIRPLGESGVSAVFHGGTWRTDEASRQVAQPPHVWFSMSEESGGADPWPLVAVDASGRVLWRNAELTNPSMEGTTVITDGEVTVANVCTERVPGLCQRHEVVGVDTATGAVRWRLPGLRSIAVAADGWALISDGGPLGNEQESIGWVLLDDRTGAAAAADQRWPGTSWFAQGCCGDIEQWVDQVGGTVLAAGPGHLRLWYPKSVDVDGTTSTVSLP